MANADQGQLRTVNRTQSSESEMEGNSARPAEVGR